MLGGGMIREASIGLGEGGVARDHYHCEPHLVSLLAAGVLALAPQPPAEREIAPECRAAAEQRTLEKHKLARCQAKADSAKVLLHDRVKTIIDCLDAK
jgi:hypothetical protein